MRIINCIILKDEEMRTIRRIFSAGIDLQTSALAKDNAFKYLLNLSNRDELDLDIVDLLNVASRLEHGQTMKIGKDEVLVVLGGRKGVTHDAESG